MLTFIEAIARQEGFGRYADNLPTRRNNPGNIEEGRFARVHGALPTDGSRYAAWATAADGYNALRALLILDYMGLTVTQALNKWAPPVENATNVYIANVCSWTGMTPNTVLTAENIG